MLKYCMMRFAQVVETFKLNSINKLLREIIYLDREAVPVEIDLFTLRPLEDFVRQSDEKLIEIKSEMLSRHMLTYPIKNRHLKAEYYLKTGYRGFAMVNAGAVSGDIWCAVSTDQRYGLMHPDESWLNIRCEKSEAYTFDMYLNPEKRGSNLAAALQNGALHELRNQGFTKAYGFFWADNIAALWVHRTLRWKELKRVKASRFILSKKLRVGTKTERVA
jgi:GNAT superfamily N-acetyltransferase